MFLTLGLVTRRVYEALRDEGTVSPRELAKRAMIEKAIPETDRKVRKDIAALFTNVAYYLTQRGKLVKIGRGEDARWRLAPTEPELL